MAVMHYGVWLLFFCQKPGLLFMFFLTLTVKSVKVVKVFSCEERSLFMSALEEIRNRFKKDHFATEVTGIMIDLAEPGKAVCSLLLEERHMNENNVPMGGAIFTLADLACAVAANGYSEKKTVSQHASITFLAPARGRRLTAEAICLKEGHTTALYAVDVKDELGTYVAHATMNGYSLNSSKERKDNK